MDTLNLIFIGLSAVATSGLLICTIISFTFIRKQTKILDSQVELSNKQIEIAKNKDILFVFQKDISSYLNQIQSNHGEFHRGLNNKLNIFKYIYTMHDNQFDELSSKKTASFYDEIDKYCDDFIQKFFCELKNNLLNYGWWLSIHEDEFNKILENHHFIKLLEFPKEYSNAIKELRKNDVYINSNLDINTVTNMNSKIYLISNETTQCLNYINKKMNDFLKKLAKDKGVL